MTRSHCWTVRPATCRHLSLGCGVNLAGGEGRRRMGLRVWMEARSLRFIATASAGEQLNGSPETRVHRVTTDSRQTQAGDLFFALPGGRFDGHDFLRQAAKQGAGAVVVERKRVPAGWSGCAIIAVQDTRKALGQLASKYRDDFALPLVVVGGSNGKTTTKELVASVLRQKIATLWSEASFNNDIGVPLTLLRLEKTHQAAVLEAGTNHPGELAPLLKMIRPNYGVITCIGREHLEFFGDLAGVRRGTPRPADGAPVGARGREPTGRRAGCASTSRV